LFFLNKENKNKVKTFIKAYFFNKKKTIKYN